MNNNKGELLSFEGKHLFNLIDEIFPEERNSVNLQELLRLVKANKFSSKLTEIHSERELILSNSTARIKYLIHDFRFTFKENKDLLKALISLFDINCWKRLKKSTTGYKFSYKNKGLTVSFNPPTDPLERKPFCYDKGIHVVLSGSGCNYENLNKIFGFTDYCQQQGFLINICRLDLALDVFNDSYYFLNKVKNHYNSKTKRIWKNMKGSAIIGEDLKDYPELPSRSIYFGLTTEQLDKNRRSKEKSPKKPVIICIYDKKAEQLDKSKHPAKLFPSLPNSWTRFEIRLADTSKERRNASVAFNRLKENRSLREVIQDAFTSKINFHENNAKSEQNTKAKWWRDLTGEGIRYNLPPKYKTESQINEIELRNRLEEDKKRLEEFTGKQFEIREKAG